MDEILASPDVYTDFVLNKNVTGTLLEYYNNSFVQITSTIRLEDNNFCVVVK